MEEMLQVKKKRVCAEWLHCAGRFAFNLLVYKAYVLLALILAAKFSIRTCSINLAVLPW